MDEPQAPNSTPRSPWFRVVTRDDAEYDQARRAWNLAVDQRPHSVALPQSADEVAGVIRRAIDDGLSVTVQGTGHNVAPLGALDNTVLVRTSAMRNVTVDATQRLARVEAGVVWGDVVPLAAAHGLAALAGSSPDVGVVGLTLGGGISWLSRRYGLISNSLVAADVVTADWGMSRVDEQHEPELFWALRGGGGSFAAVTAMELRLYPVPELTAGALFWPLERAGEVLEAWRRWLPSVPDELTSCGHLLQFPPIPEIPDPMRGRSFVVVEVAHLGGVGQTNEMLAAFRVLGPAMDTVAQASPNDLLMLHMDPPAPVPAVGDGMLLSSVSESTLDALLSVVGAGSGSPLLSVELRHLGGALSRSTANGGARSSLDAEFSFFAAGFVPDEAIARLVGERIHDAKRALAQWRAAQDYLNFRESTEDPARLFPPDVLDGLRRVKQRYDPGNVFRANHPIRVAA